WVALISNIGRLADLSQNLLLKTLEEPHPNRVIILTSPSLSPFVVIPTIVSRCQRVSFHPVAEGEIAQLLVSAGVAADRADELAGGDPPADAGRPAPGHLGAAPRALLRHPRPSRAERQPQAQPGVLPARSAAGVLKTMEPSYLKESLRGFEPYRPGQQPPDGED